MKAFAIRCAFLIPIAWLFGCSSQPTHVEQFALAPQHSCALLDDGTVKCWGFRPSGALADGAPLGPGFPDFQLSAVKVQGLSAGASQIAAGATWTCALLKTGAVQCWGAPVGAGVSPPTTVPGLEGNVTGISGQGSSVCALKADGGVWCWGTTGDPQIGRQEHPVLVTLPLSARLIAVGEDQACAALVDGSVWCWGKSDSTFFSNSPERSALQTPVAMGPLPNVEWRALGLNWGYACALAPDGALYCWGYSPELKSSSRRSYQPAAVELGAPADQMSLGASHACVLLQGGTMRCWGSGSEGQLGIGNTTARDCAVSYSACSRDTLVAPAGLGNVRRIGAGRSTTCAAQTDGEVLCWGGNNDGALGNGTRWNGFQPQPVLGL